GYIGFAAYASYIWKGMSRAETIGLITVVGVINVALLYRRIHSIAKLTVSLWVGTLITVLAVIVTAALNFDLDFPELCVGVPGLALGAGGDFSLRFRFGGVGEVAAGGRTAERHRVPFAVHPVGHPAPRAEVEGDR